jgi:flagellar biosynthesis protein FlhG
MTRIITITSGKGGVGKTSIAVNLAFELAQREQRVCLLDAGSGPTNAAMLLGLKPRYTLRDLTASGPGLGEVLIRNCYGLDIVAGGSETPGMVGLRTDELQRLTTALGELDPYHFIVIDTASGIARNLLSLSLASTEVVLVVTPEPTSMRDAYALLKLLHAQEYGGDIRVVVNRVKTHRAGSQSYDKFREVVAYYLGRQIPLLGLVGEDERMRQAVQARTPLLSRNPDSPAARDICALADELLSGAKAVAGISVRGFWRRYLQLVTTRHYAAPQASTRPAAERVNRGLQRQLEHLSAQIDNLIAEIARLREVENRNIGVSASPGPQSTASFEGWIAGLSAGSEDVSLQGESFRIYRIRQPDGRYIPCACHGHGDDLQTAEPRSTLV